VFNQTYRDKKVVGVFIAFFVRPLGLSGSAVMLVSIMKE
jgi:hypothetical protein